MLYHLLLWHKGQYSQGLASKIELPEISSVFSVAATVNQLKDVHMFCFMITLWTSMKCTYHMVLIKIKYLCKAWFHNTTLNFIISSYLMRQKKDFSSMQSWVEDSRNIKHISLQVTNYPKMMIFSTKIFSFRNKCWIFFEFMFPEVSICIG